MIQNVSSEFLAKIDRLAEIRRENIRNSVSDIAVTGTAYYVSADGCDDSDGKSPETAWKSTARVNREDLLPGDVVFYRRGDVFRGKLEARTGITYSAYGTGCKPVLTTSPFDGAKHGSWIPTEIPNIYRYSEPMPYDIGTMIFDGGKEHAYKCTVHFRRNVNLTTGKPFHTWKDLCGDLHFYHDFGGPIFEDKENGGTLYLCSEKGNPSDRFSSIEFNVRLHGIFVHGANTRINNLAIRYVGLHGIGAFSTDVRCLTVDWCEFEWIGGSIQDYNNGAPIRYGNAVEIYGGLTDYTIANCYVNQVYDAGITHQLSSGGTESYLMNGVVYAGNLIENCVYSIEYFIGPADNGAKRFMSHVRILDNILRHAGEGWGAQRPDKNANAHIKSWDSPNYAENQVISGNIFDRSKTYMLHVAGEKHEYIPSITNNLFIQYEGGSLGRIGLTPTPNLPYTDETVCTHPYLDDSNRFYVINN